MCTSTNEYEHDQIKDNEMGKKCNTHIDVMAEARNIFSESVKWRYHLDVYSKDYIRMTLREIGFGGVD